MTPVAVEEYIGGAPEEPPVADDDGVTDILPLKQASQWEGEAIPERQWLIQDRIPMHNVTLLSGEGSIGKSILIHQLAVSTCLNRDWLGGTPESGPVIVVSAEEDEAEFQRRLVPMLHHYDATFSDLENLHAVCLAGKDAVLAAPDRSGIMRPTPLFHALRQQAKTIKPKLITLDNAADVFAGNENDRAQVRQFVTLIRGLAVDSGSAVLLSSHPSLTGISSGTGLSGSTAWHNSVRARAVMTATKNADGENDSDLRTLEMRKNNYGPIAAKILLRWQDGMFLPVGSGGSDWMAKMANDSRVDELFKGLLIKLTANGQTVSDKPSNSYAPTVFACLEAAEGIRKEAFAKSMQRLLDSGQIRIDTFGPPSRQRSRLIIAG